MNSGSVINIYYAHRQPIGDTPNCHNRHEYQGALWLTGIRVNRKERKGVAKDAKSYNRGLAKYAKSYDKIDNFDFKLSK